MYPPVTINFKGYYNFLNFAHDLLKHFIVKKNYTISLDCEILIL